MSTGPNILTLDIETLPLTAYNWSLFEEPRALDRLVEEWAIASFAAKWFDSKKIIYADNNTPFCASAYDDAELVKRLCGLLNEADVVIGHNIRNFDMRKIRARAIHHNCDGFQEPMIIDTLEIAKGLGMFTSNKLEYLSNLVDTQKSKHKKYPGFALWLGMINNEREAWAECKKYNITDVKATEELWVKLRKWARKHPDLGAWYRDDKRRCPRCGDSRTHPAGDVLVGSTFRRTYTCENCGGYSRERSNCSKGLVCI